MTQDTRTPEQLQADYAEYCEAKAEINEQPLSYDQWLELEKEAYKDF